MIVIHSACNPGMLTDLSLMPCPTKAHIMSMLTLGLPLKSEEGLARLQFRLLASNDNCSTVTVANLMYMISYCTMTMTSWYKIHYENPKRSRISLSSA